MKNYMQKIIIQHISQKSPILTGITTDTLYLGQILSFYLASGLKEVRILD